MTGLASGSNDAVLMTGLGWLDTEQTTAYINFTPPCDDCSLYGRNKQIYLDRYLSPDDIETVELDVMPGFRVSWWYTSSDGVEITPDDLMTYDDAYLTKHFVR